MSKKNAKRYTPEFKARVALEAAQEQESLAQLGKRYGVHPVLIGQWKKQLLSRAADAFLGHGNHAAGTGCRSCASIGARAGRVGAGNSRS